MEWENIAQSNIGVQESEEVKEEEFQVASSFFGGWWGAEKSYQSLNVNVLQKFAITNKLNDTIVFSFDGVLTFGKIDPKAN